MKSFNFLHSTRLGPLQLLDIALILALLPHLFILKLPMLVYLFVGLLFIIRKKDSRTTVFTFMFLGLIAIGLSFFAEYNFSNVSRLLVFISILISLLTYAVVLQRLTRQINVYLLVSPAMLMILSFFFYNSIGMLFYSLFTLFIFTLLLLYERMQSSLKNALRVNILLYLFSLPIVLLLFLVFPRISYKNASFGFKGEEIKRTGHDGTMYIDSNALLVPSSKLVMEVSFEKEVPLDKHLYFRGSTLYVDKQKRWVHGEKSAVRSPKVLDAKTIINYKVKLYPHKKRFIYMLDLPLSTPKESSTDSDYITLAKLPLLQTLSYTGTSSLFYKTQEVEQSKLGNALQVDRFRDPKTYKKLQEHIDIKEKDNIKAEKLLKFFSSLDLSYSLKPKAIDLEHPVDSFLLDSKIGYCVHFAAAFASSARMIGLPSRIVTGYKADANNAINNYLIVTEADAHAWVEIYLKHRGWVRFEPTATARHFLLSDERGVANTYTKTTYMGRVFKEINIYYMYTRHIINTWILHYDRLKQLTLLKEILSDTVFLLKFALSVFGFILLCVFIFVVLQKRQCEDLLLCEMQPLLKLLRTEGFVRSQGETMYDFLIKIGSQDKRYEGVNDINRLYHEERYGKKNKERSALLREKIHSFKTSILNG